MPPVIDRERCNGCGTCDWHCPVDVIHMDSEQNLAVVKYPDECWHCGVCRMDCREDAVKIVFPPRMLMV